MMHTIKQFVPVIHSQKLVGGALNALLRVQPRLNPSLRNGALVLGLNGIVKSHGHADALGIATAIAAARKACVSATDRIIRVAICEKLRRYK